MNAARGPIPSAAKNSFRSNSSNSPCSAISRMDSGILYVISTIFGNAAYGFSPGPVHSAFACCSSAYVQLNICSSMNSPDITARNGVPDRKR